MRISLYIIEFSGGPMRFMAFANADKKYFRECETSELTKQEVLNMRKRQRQHTNKLNMQQFYLKKIRINSD